INQPKWPDQTSQSTHLSGFQTCLASSRCSKLVSRSGLCHRAQSIMCVANELENLGLQLGSNLWLDPGHELQRVLEHLNAIAICDPCGRVLGRRNQKPSRLFILCPALEVKCDLGSQLSLAGTPDTLQPLSYRPMKPGSFPRCNTPINGLTVQRMP